MGSQIDKVCTSVQKKYGILRKICRYISQETALLIDKVMIRPHFDYGDFRIDSWVQSKIEKMERIQDKIVRTIEYEYRPEKREDIKLLRLRNNIDN